MRKTLLVISLLPTLEACQPRNQSARDTTRTQASDATAQPATPGTVPETVVPESTSTVPTAAEPAAQTPAAGQTTAALPATPPGCSGASSIDAKDLVLFAGETLTVPAPNSLQFKNGWMGNEAWDNGRLQFDANRTTVTFGNEAIYHGFKLTPPAVNGQRATFTVTGADVYVEAVRANPNAPLPTFGLRVIKPGEPEDNGGAPTTTWMMDKPTGGTRFLTIPQGCTLIKMVIPPTFIDQKSVATRFIWEMQSNWNPTDMLHIHRIVLKGFQTAP